MDMTLRRVRFPRGRRWELVAGYLMAASAGVSVLWASGFSGRVGDLLGWVSVGWSVFMLAGGVLASWGQLWQTWTGERVGIIAMFTASWFMAVVLLVVSLTVTGRSTSLALAFTLASFGFVLFGRWKTVNGFAEADRLRANRGG